MTRALPLLAAGATLLAGCAASRPEYTPPRRDAMGTAGMSPASMGAGAPGFDAATWLERARAADLVMTVDGASDAATMARLADEKRLTAELDAAVGWVRACDTYWDATQGREVTAPFEGNRVVRGTYSLYPVGPGETVAAVVCEFGAYQGSYALVRLRGPRAELLRAAYVGFDGSTSAPPSAVFSTPAFAPGSRTFETLALDRGIGDCGVLSQYRLEATGVTLVQARARDCDDRPAAAPPPEAWPVVFPRP